MRAFLALPFVALFGLAAWQEPTAATVELELVYLANEGFLVRAGEHSLVIDAFVTEPYGEYAAVPAALFADLLSAKPPFEDIDLALASHAHRDHFQAKPAADFLRARSATRFLSSPQVADELLSELGEHSAAGRIEALLPEARETLAAPAAAVHVELLRLPHTGGARTAEVQNLGHLIELGGVRLLHVGDADIQTEDLAGYALAKRALDVALVPYWWLGNAAGVARARELTGARHLVAVHVPPAEVAAVKAHLAALDPALLLFERSGEVQKLVLAR
ncbi:MAG: MBL fold metallo-hydrolase [Planctomycetes bacterium]|nr:MBL fold metallo-hydrolase [Planctomycetota bacterium]